MGLVCLKMPEAGILCGPYSSLQSLSEATHSNGFLGATI